MLHHSQTKPHANPKTLVKEHFKFFYQTVSQSKKNAECVTKDDLFRVFSGIPFIFFNAVLGTPKTNWESIIQEQQDYFQKAEVPFVWYVEENEAPTFQQKLKNFGFKEAGTFQGVFGHLNHELPYFKIREGFETSEVRDDPLFDQCNDLICQTFGMQGAVRKEHGTLMWNLAKKGVLSHLVATKKGKVISTVTILFQDNMMSFWNVATDPNFRKMGLCSALFSLAVEKAKAKGCEIGMSYLMADAMLLGLCKKFGFDTKWRFNVFLFG